MVNSVNGGKKKRMKEDAKKNKRESQKVGGQNSAPTLKTQLSWLIQPLKKEIFFFFFCLFF